MKESYVYIIINKIRSKNDDLPKYYIGYKMVARDKGGYYGSCKMLTEDIKINGINNFFKIVLKRFNSDIEARQYEEKLLNYFNARYNKKFYNLTNGDADFVTKPQHGAVCFKGNNRTEKQKQGDKNKYKIRSEKRVLADKKHSYLMRQKYKAGLLNRLFEGRKNWRYTFDGSRRWEKIKQELSTRKKGKNKYNDNGRLITSKKLKNNESAKKGAVKLANMSENDFANYLLTISQHPNIQQQMKTRRLKGVIYLSTGVWEKHSPGKKYVDVSML